MDDILDITEEPIMEVPKKKKKLTSQRDNIEYYMYVLREPLAIFAAVMIFDIPFVKDKAYEYILRYSTFKNAVLRGLIIVALTFIIKSKFLS